MIVKKKILIYDTSKGYFRFIKLNFRDFEVDNFSMYSNLNEVNIDDYVAIFFIINCHRELLDLVCFQIKETPIFIGSPSNEIDAKIKNFENIIYLDLKKSKNDILNFLKFIF